MELAPTADTLANATAADSSPVAKPPSSFRRLRIDALAEQSPVLVPVPLDGRGQRFTNLEVIGANVIQTITATSGQQAFVLEPHECKLSLQLTFASDPEVRLLEWVWHAPSNALNDASSELVQFARECRSSSDKETVRRLAEHVVSRFYYGPGEGRFTDGQPVGSPGVRHHPRDVHRYPYLLFGGPACCSNRGCVYRWSFHPRRGDRSERHALLGCSTRWRRDRRMGPLACVDRKA